MIEFYAAVARKSKDGFSDANWHPEQAVSREQALQMLTRWPAYAAFQEKEKGSIEKGKLADLTILSDDIMKIPEAKILQTRCLMTVIGGEIVYDGIVAVSLWETRVCVRLAYPAPEFWLAFRTAKRLQQRQLRSVRWLDTCEAHAQPHQSHLFPGARKRFREQIAIFA